MKKIIFILKSSEYNYSLIFSLFLPWCISDILSRKNIVGNSYFVQTSITLYSIKLWINAYNRGMKYWTHNFKFTHNGFHRNNIQNLMSMTSIIWIWIEKDSYFYEYERFLNMTISNLDRKRIYKGLLFIFFKIRRSLMRVNIFHIFTMKLYFQQKLIKNWYLTSSSN